MHDEVDFVGGDPNSPDGECAAVHVDRVTGGVFYVGKAVAAPEVLAKLGGHRVIGADEAVVWQPDRMKPIVLEALTGTYEGGREGPGYPAFGELLETATRSVVHLELRDSYEEVSAFRKWRDEGIGDAHSYEWGDYPQQIAAAVARGVRVRRARIVSEPVSDYIRWEHMLTEVNIKAGEEVRWLPRRQAWGLICLPPADFFMFDQTLVRFGFQRGDGSNTREYEFTSDPRVAAQCVAAFEMVWERAMPHEDYQV
jgi:hypothetical protein